MRFGASMGSLGFLPASDPPRLNSMLPGRKILSDEDIIYYILCRVILTIESNERKLYGLQYMFPQVKVTISRAFCSDCLLHGRLGSFWWKNKYLFLVETQCCYLQYCLLL